MLASLDWSVLWQRLFHPDHEFMLALWRTVYIAVAAQLLGVILGLIAALMRMSRLAPLRLLSGLYVLIFRGTPVIVWTGKDLSLDERAMLRASASAAVWPGLSSRSLRGSMISTLGTPSIRPVMP